ncbi:MAG: hypothetical protein JXA60_10085 [Candidatus Coatesbacteria bacterium]|nr:hypothetical protein [Candidatus Coatesbacteria bacterium]
MLKILRILFIVSLFALISLACFGKKDNETRPSGSDATKNVSAPVTTGDKKLPDDLPLLEGSTIIMVTEKNAVVQLKSNDLNKAFKDYRALLKKDGWSEFGVLLADENSTVKQVQVSKGDKKWTLQFSMNEGLINISFQPA